MAAPERKEPIVDARETNWGRSISDERDMASPDKRTTMSPEKRDTAAPERRITALPDRGLEDRGFIAPDTASPEKRGTNWDRSTIVDERDTAVPDKRTTMSPEKRDTAAPERRTTALLDRDLEDRGFIAPDGVEDE
jgi:hypothetical protein